MNKLYILFYFIFINLTFATEPIIIASKSFSESVLISEITAQLLEKKFNQTVIRKFGLGGTKVAFDALNNGGIHLYADYTGTGYVMILKMDGERDPEKVYQIVKSEYERKWNITWSPPLGFNNTYALAVKRSDPRFKNITKVSQLSKKVSNYRYAAPYEFMERKDGHSRFSKAYDLNFSPDKLLSMQAGLMYSAIKDNSVDMIIVYSTDGRNKAMDLKVLEDDLKFFPPYYASLIAKKETIAKFPILKEVFLLLGNKITEEIMVNMNDDVDRLKKDPKNVATNFLINQGLISGENIQTKQLGTIDFFIGKRAYLFKLLKEHLAITFGALFFAVLVSIPTGVMLTRYPKMGKIVFPIINTIQTIPSLALLGFLIPFMGIGFPPALLALFL